MSLVWRLMILCAIIITIAVTAMTFVIHGSIEQRLDKYMSAARDTVSQLRQEINALRLTVTLQGWQLDPNDTIMFCGIKYALSHEVFRERLQYELSMMFNRQGWLSEQVRLLGRYQLLIRRELESAGLPQDLVYMFVWESGLGPRAVSRTGATGIGQFIVSSARRFGIQMNDQYDERMDVYKAVRAACQYLKTYYPYFNDWLLTLAAYNYGPYGVISQLASQGVTKYEDLILPQETYRYVFQIMAVHYVMERKLLGDMPWLILHSPLPPAERIMYNVKQTTTLWELSRALGLDYQTFRLLNQHFLGVKIIPGKYPINVPRKK